MASFLTIILATILYPNLIFAMMLGIYLSQEKQIHLVSYLSYLFLTLFTVMVPVRFWFIPHYCSLPVPVMIWSVE